jgi:nickel-dependent lactate racemase
MDYNFPYPDIPGIKIPDDCLTSIYEVKSVTTQSTPAQMIMESIRHPIGMARFSKLLNRHSKVLIIVDDISRPTSCRLIIPPLLDEIYLAGVPDENIKFLIALGTHRPMTPAEMVLKVGAAVVQKFTVMNHEWNNPAALANYGELADGTKVILNKEMSQADFVIGIGTIAPHPAAGFSGGGKIIAPGVATEEAAGNFHWQSVHFPQREVLGVRDNPMRTAIDEIAQKAGLKAIINVVADGNNNLFKVVAGDPVEAHRVGCRYALDIFGVKIKNPHQYDIFIADSHPMDQEMWQAVKGMCALDVIVPDNAVTILVTPCPEGVCKTHPEILKYAYTTLEEAAGLVVRKHLSKVAAHNMVQGGRLIKRTTAFLVSPGVSAAEAEKLGFKYFNTARQALDAALEIKGSPAKILILRMGGDICPIVERTENYRDQGNFLKNFGIGSGTNFKNG